MAGISFTALEQLPDVLSTGRFEVDIAPIPGVSQDAAMHFKLRCQQVDFVGVQVEQMTVALHGHELNYRGRQVFSKQMAMSFVETADGETFNSLMAWKETCVGTRSGNGAYRREYAALIKVAVLDVTGRATHTRKVYYAWPTDIQQVQLDGSQGSNAFLISASLSFDHAENEGQDIDTFGEEVTI